MKAAITALTEGTMPYVGSPDDPARRRQLDSWAGTYERFLAAMHAGLATATIPDGDYRGERPLAGLNRADRDNWVMALLSAWAAAGDVLTFYQERIANEGFLGTAVEDLSIRELVLSLGYVPHFGAAGTADLVFSLLQLPELPSRSRIDRGTRVLSVPVEEALPQAFETVERIDGDAALDALRPLLATVAVPQSFAAGAIEALVEGAPSGLVPGAALVLLDATEAPPGPGAPLRFLRTAVAVDLETTARPGEVRSRVQWLRPLAVASPLSDPELHLLSTRTYLFGHNAPEWASQPEAIQRREQPVLGGLSLSNDRGAVSRSDNSGLPAAPVRALALAADGARYASLEGQGLYRSLGETWEAVGGGTLPAEPLTLVCDPGGRLCAGTARGVFRSEDRGETWDAVGADLTVTARRSWWRRLLDRLAGRRFVSALSDSPVRSLLLVAKTEGTVLYAGTDSGAFRFDGPSRGWRAINRGLPETDRATGLTSVPVTGLADGGSGELVAATARGVFRRPRGRPWRPVNLGLPGRLPWAGTTTTPVDALAVVSDPRGEPPRWLAGTSEGAFRSDDRGETWQPLDEGLDGGAGPPPAITQLVVSTDAEARALYLFAGAATGVLRSDDRGESWRPVATGAPDPRVEALAADDGGRLLIAQPFAGYADADWPGLRTGGRTLDLETTVAGIVPGGWLALSRQGDEGEPQDAVYRIEQVHTVRRDDFGTAATVTRVELDRDDRLAEFDPRQTTVHAVSSRLELAPAQRPTTTLLQPREVVVAPALGGLLRSPRRVAVSGKRLRAARLVPGAVPERYVEIASERPEVAIAGWTGNGAETLEVRLPAGHDLAGDRGLVTLPPDALEPIPADEDEPTVTYIGRVEEIAPERPPAVASGLASGTYSVLVLDPPPAVPLDAATVTLSANVAEATQGETVPDEVLGSGDATRANQRFGLKKPPLTHIRDPSSGQVVSTLRVHVGDVEWRQVESLYAAGPRDRVYMLVPDQRGKPEVVFGDGVHGARLPTGVENVWARYRSGLWEDPVEPERLTLLQTRPPGLRGVSNPLPASAGTAPESMVSAREAAPRSVRALGRVVSLQDFESFALTRPEVAKARVRRLWCGGTRPRVHLTVAATGGGETRDDSDLVRDLARAIATAGGRTGGLLIQGCLRVSFRVEAALTVGPGREARRVLARARKSLAAAFGFTAAELEGTVPASALIATLHAVEGVVAVHLLAFHKSGDDRRLERELRARPARWIQTTGRARPAELLTVDPHGIRLTT